MGVVEWCGVVWCGLGGVEWEGLAGTSSVAHHHDHPLALRLLGPHLTVLHATYQAPP